MLILSSIITGLGLGSMYGLIALGFHVTYVVSSTVNFAQGSSMTLGAVLGYILSGADGWPFAACGCGDARDVRAVRPHRGALPGAAVR